MAVILNARGEPELPDAIKRRLATLDGGFSLVRRSGCWWLMQRWRQDDPRWQFVQSGEIPEANAADGLGAFPIDMPMDQIPAFIEKSLREYPVRDLKRLAEVFARGETLAPASEEIKGEMLDDVIKMTESDRRVTGRRTLFNKLKDLTKKKE